MVVQARRRVNVHETYVEGYGQISHKVDMCSDRLLKNYIFYGFRWCAVCLVKFFFLPPFLSFRWFYAALSHSHSRYRFPPAHLHPFTYFIRTHLKIRFGFSSMHTICVWMSLVVFFVVVVVVFSPFHPPVECLCHVWVGVWLFYLRTSKP